MIKPLNGAKIAFGARNTSTIRAVEESAHRALIHNATAFRLPGRSALWPFMRERSSAPSCSQPRPVVCQLRGRVASLQPQKLRAIALQQCSRARAIRAECKPSGALRVVVSVAAFGGLPDGRGTRVQHHRNLGPVVAVEAQPHDHHRIDAREVNMATRRRASVS